MTMMLSSKVQNNSMFDRSNTEFMGNLMYSPNLVCNDFYQFSSTENKLQGLELNYGEWTTNFDAKRSSWCKYVLYKMHDLKIPQSEWKRWFENCFKCMQKLYQTLQRLLWKTIKPFGMINIRFHLLFRIHKWQSSPIP